MKEVHQEIE